MQLGGPAGGPGSGLAEQLEDSLCLSGLEGEELEEEGEEGLGLEGLDEETRRLVLQSVLAGAEGEGRCSTLDPAASRQPSTAAQTPSRGELAV